VIASEDGGTALDRFAERWPRTTATLSGLAWVLDEIGVF